MDTLITRLLYVTYISNVWIIKFKYVLTFCMDLLFLNCLIFSEDNAEAEHEAEPLSQSNEIKNDEEHSLPLHSSTHHPNFLSFIHLTSPPSFPSFLPSRLTSSLRATRSSSLIFLLCISCLPSILPFNYFSIIYLTGPWVHSTLHTMECKVERIGFTYKSVSGLLVDGNRVLSVTLGL